MKKLVALGVAGALALTALAGTVTPSEAGGPHPRFHKGPAPHWNNRGPGIGAGAFIAGTIIGLGVAAAASQPRYYEPYPAYPAAYPPVYGGNPHVQWCFQHYPNSYNPQTNTWVGYDGLTYYCDSPYN